MKFKRMKATHYIGAFTVAIDDKFGADGGRDYNLATVTHGDPDDLLDLAALMAAAPRMLAVLQQMQQAQSVSAIMKAQAAVDAAIKAATTRPNISR